MSESQHGLGMTRRIPSDDASACMSKISSGRGLCPGDPSQHPDEHYTCVGTIRVAFVPWGGRWGKGSVSRDHINGIFRYFLIRFCV